MDVYRELERRANDSPTGGRRFEVRVRGIEPVAVLQSYLSSNGVRDVVVESRPDLSGLKGTPSVVVLDGQGRVQASWTGKLSKAQTERLWKHLD